MNRSLTNKIRFLMDECVPAIVRDSKWFMWPFFVLAYHRLDVADIMAFKRRVWQMSEQEYDDFYSGLNSISRRRHTDINAASLVRIRTEIGATAGSVLDIGCGGGYLLRYLQESYPKLSYAATDVFANHPQLVGVDYRKGRAEALPFADKAFDVVTCCHVLEHLRDPATAVAEMKRVARHRLIIAVPRQRPYFYTLDEHIQFFQYAEQLTQLVGLDRFRCELIDGDWLYIGEMEHHASVV